MSAQAVLLQNSFHHEITFPFDPMVSFKNKKNIARADKDLTRAKHILSIGDDAVLLNTRHLLLHSWGYEVVSVPSLTYLEDDLIRSFDLLILCHTVYSDRIKIATTIHAIHPGMSVLFLRRTQQSDSYVSDFQSVEPYPPMLLHKVQQMLDDRHRPSLQY